MRRVFGWVALLLASCASPAMPIEVEPSEPAPMPPAEMPPWMPPAMTEFVELETVLHVEEVAAGAVVSATCQFRDAAGAIIVENIPTSTVRFEPEASFVIDEEDRVRAARAGDANATCVADVVGLIDTTPAPLTIVPGPAHSISTTLDKPTLVAGEALTIDCKVLDLYGNATEAATRLEVSPSGEANFIFGSAVVFQTVGQYSIACATDGAELIEAQLLDVVPALPAHFSIAAVPDRNHYQVGEVITFETMVSDEFGNEVPEAVVNMYGTQPSEAFGNNAFRFMAEGEQYVVAVVAQPTLGSTALIDYLPLDVGGLGPSIDCVSPGDAGTVGIVGTNLTTTSDVDFQGRVRDPNGIATVFVNDAAVAVAADGLFSRDVFPRFGMNFVEIRAIDEFGAENRKICTFLYAPSLVPMPTYLSTVGFELTKNGFDDHNRTDGLDSVTDILTNVLQSEELPNTLHQALLAANPIVPEECYLEDYFGTCWGYWEMTYHDLEFDGPHDLSIEPVDGGIRLDATLRNLGMYIAIDGTFELEGWVYVDSIHVDITFDAGLQFGHPHVSVRSVNEVDAGYIDTELDGFAGWILDLFEDAVQDYLQEDVEDALSDFVSEELSGKLDGLLSRLEIPAFETGFSVPRLNGSSMSLNLGLQVHSMATTSNQMLFGLRTRVMTPSVHSRPPAFVPLEAFPTVADPGVSSPNTTGATTNGALLNQFLYAFWRGGLFDATFADNDLGTALPQGSSITIETHLPPVAQMINAQNRVQVMFGAIRAELTYPGLFEEPISIQLGGVVSCPASISAGDLQLGAVQIDELYISTDDLVLPASTTETIEDIAAAILGDMLDASLRDGIPALPIPSFEIPSSLSPYGLPGGKHFGVVSPQLDIFNQHIELDARLGIQP